MTEHVVRLLICRAMVLSKALFYAAAMLAIIAGILSEKKNFTMIGDEYAGIFWVMAIVFCSAGQIVVIWRNVRKAAGKKISN